MGQRTCPHCGTTNAQDARTCSWCGRSLDEDATQPLAGPVPPQSGGEQPSAEGWRRGDTVPAQPSAGSWDQAPTQPQPQSGAWEPPSPAQPSPGSWDPTPTQRQPQSGAWEPPSPAQPWDQAPTQQQPQGASWEAPSPAQPSAGSWDPAPTSQQPQGGWEAAEQQPAEGAWQPGAGQASGGAWEPGGAQQPPPPPGGGWQQPADASPGWGQQPAWGAQRAGGQAQWGTMGQAPPRRGKPVLWIVLGVVVVLALIGVAVAVTNIGGTVRKVARSNEPLQAPASIGGLARIDSGGIRSTLDQQSNQLREKGAKNFVVAAYGTQTQPQFVLVAVREANDKTRQDITTGFDQALVQQSGGAARQDQTYKQGGVEYRCTSSQFGATVAICRFNDGDVVGFGFSGTQNTQRVSQFTAEARDKMK